LEIGSASAERAGQEGGGCIKRMQTAWLHLGSSLRNNLIGTGRAIFILFGTNGARNKQSHLVGPPFPVFKAQFSATADWHFSRGLTL